MSSDPAPPSVSAPTAAGRLFVVGTPIGNLEDITLRALRVLKEADLVAAEDTRHSIHLLNHFEIKKPLVSYHQFNEAKRVAEFREHFAHGKNIALISDAGMPGISDPGERLIRSCVEAGITVEVVPGPSAVLQALVGAGFPMVPFHFGGFLPPKSGGRRREMEEAAARPSTSVYFESPHRLVRALADALEVIPERELCVARELTKKFEEIRRGTPAELLAHYEAHAPRGEVCLVIRGADAKELREAAKEAAREARFSEKESKKDSQEAAGELLD
ncbi:16S rRNA (cytidine1402-2'-O)-methyltransferase [Verrucomicrobium sp. GAS474]|uniref:16S rRNA (cytidine(1402)-2'-O)-methyltransferase n=1 Tax=Verrucomicrobium sp. GAS474 TaxID=1882831 RepID=UPI00087DC9B7|nr:16S rRNA (cytidine(1402)-2'-O)-methyltransferase [Verrucomicrobium sp. GAS474]SDU29817.1 16S rRNA (cytidine1402-2'-O)-methyltransferase [Verrucomicrobium sp. GAS474]